MEYSKLSLEMTSPEYINHFYSLSQQTKSEVLASQDALYKGINFSLINNIYDELYRLSLDNATQNIKLATNADFLGVSRLVNDKYSLLFKHTEVNNSFTDVTDAVIFATGYQYKLPAFINPVKELIQWNTVNKFEVNRNYSIDKNNSIYIQNAELHTHGFNTPDLGMGPYRNAIIINSILDYKVYAIEENSSFQTFGLPQALYSSFFHNHKS
jgi:lysine N6-hydroxylase